MTIKKLVKRGVKLSQQILTNDWKQYLNEEFTKPYYKKLRTFLKEAYTSKTIYPDMNDIYKALHITAFSDVKVVILGQDTYYGSNQANGLSFSVQKGVPLPPSLKNIFKELAEDINVQVPKHGDLTGWAKQGVLLLNDVLTVEAGNAHSHRNMGWEQFTDKVITSLNEKDTPIVYILWGKAAQMKEQLIDTNKHHIVKSVHPSPLSAYRGFFGSKPFSQTNDLLKADDQKPIDWGDL